MTRLETLTKLISQAEDLPAGAFKIYVYNYIREHFSAEEITKAKIM